MAVGTKWRETRKRNGNETTREVKVTAFEPGKLCTIECDSHGALRRTVFQFEPFGNRETIVRCKVSVEPRTLMAKLLAVFANGTLRKLKEQDLEDLKTAAEKG